MMKYPKVFALGEEPIENILNGEVVVEEKIDGSQFRITILPDGTIFCGSKNEDYDKVPAAKMFKMAVEIAEGWFDRKQFFHTMDIIHSMSDKLYDQIYVNRDEINIFCEFLSTKSHNTLNYDRVPENNIVIFDVKVGNEWLNADNKRLFAHSFGFEVSPTIFSGNGKDLTVDKINELLTTHSFLGGTQIEGIVVKNYSQNYNIMRYPYLNGMFLVGKYVREDFKEKNKSKWKEIKKGPVETLIETLRNENRWNKAFQHLNEKGEITNSPRDIGPIIKEVMLDVETEESENIKKALFDHYWKQIANGMIKKLPEWYKQKLLKNLEKENGSS